MSRLMPGAGHSSKLSASLAIVKLARLLRVFALISYALAGNAYADFPRPIGIYLLGDQGGTVTQSLMAKPFVDGFAMRTAWSTLEPTSGTYSFSSIDSTIAAVQLTGKKMTLVVFAFQPPAYVQADAGVTTYTAVGPGGSDAITVVPWDSLTQSRWSAFCNALANHLVADSSQPGSPLVPLKNHPTLAQIDCPVLGMNGIRDLSSRLVSAPSYNRTTFIAACKTCVHLMMDQFPGKFHYLAFFRMTDATASPALDTTLYNALIAEFDGTVNPRLGMFAENLACSTPTSTFAFAQYQGQSVTFTLFQMLQPWVSPFSNTGATDACLVTTTPGDRSTATSGPEVGIQYAFNTFGCRYFEVYKADLQQAAFEDEFNAMHALITGSPAGIANWRKWE